MTSLRIFLQAFALLIAMTASAMADPYEEALPKFAADSYADTEAALSAVAGSGHVRALSLVEALRDELLVREELVGDEITGVLEEARLAALVGTVE